MDGCFYLNQIMKIKYLFISFVLFQSFLSSAQSENLWTRYTISKKINKIYIAAEYQCRKQGQEKLSHIFDDPMLHSFRLWFHIDLNDHFKLITTPGSHFRHFIVTEANEVKTIHSLNEFRSMLGLEYKNDLNQRLNLKNRLGIEYRNFYDNHTDQFRYRYLLSLTTHLNKHFDFIAFDEVFFNGLDHQMDFDHNRSGANISYKHLQSFTIDLGYFLSIKNNQTRSNVINIMFNKIL